MGALTLTPTNGSAGELAYRPQQPQGFMPVMTIQDAVARRDAVVALVKQILVENVDYGPIPGSAKAKDGTDKKVLLKPGAEKLSTFFGFSAQFTCIEKIQDWAGRDFGGSPFFSYTYKCSICKNGLPIGECEANCNSWEVKYRYRQGERLCPECSKATIIKGKKEYGGGFLCFAKKGGCGAKFADDDDRITGQEVGRVANPDAADLVNTLMKMSQKRALIGAVLIAANASEYFTQDLDDYEPAVPPDSAPPAQQQQPQGDGKPDPHQQTEGQAQGARHKFLQIVNKFKLTKERVKDDASNMTIDDLSLALANMCGATDIKELDTITLAEKCDVILKMEHGAAFQFISEKAHNQRNTLLDLAEKKRANKEAAQQPAKPQPAAAAPQQQAPASDFPEGLPSIAIMAHLGKRVGNLPLVMAYMRDQFPDLKQSEYDKSPEARNALQALWALDKPTLEGFLKNDGGDETDE